MTTITKKMMAATKNAKNAMVERTQNLMKDESGSAIVGFVMVMAITVGVFLIVNPSMRTMATNMMATVTTWFTNNVASIFS